LILLHLKAHAPCVSMYPDYLGYFRLILIIFQDFQILLKLASKSQNKPSNL